MQNLNTIISPIVSEKAMKAGEKNIYCFLVSPRASKSSIKNAIEEMFKVKVESVQTSLNKGGRQRIGTRRVEVARPSTKKAFVKLKKGDKIGLFEPGNEIKSEKNKKK